MEKQEKPLFYSVSAIAQAAKVSSQTISAFIREGRIPAVRHGKNRWVVKAEDLPRVRKWFILASLPGEEEE